VALDLSQPIAGYALLAPLGKGAMGEVFRAKKPGAEAVALKVMAPSLGEIPELVERFRREAMAAARVDHPNITRVIEFGEDGGRLFMAMELLDGHDLGKLIQSGATGEIESRIRVITQAALGMAAVHAHGLVHRDLKPANLHVKNDGVVKIMDFGLVRLEDSEMTATGMVMGSPSYMSPELIKGHKADARADVFSLGAVCYEVLAGTRAFPGKGITQVMMSVLSSEPQPLTQLNPQVPQPLERVVTRCLRKDPDERYQSAGELAAALEVVRDVYAA
jgi:serine/threonine-protein kinase